MCPLLCSVHDSSIESMESFWNRACASIIRLWAYVNSGRNSVELVCFWLPSNKKTSSWWSLMWIWSNKPSKHFSPYLGFLLWTPPYQHQLGDFWSTLGVLSGLTKDLPPSLCQHLHILRTLTCQAFAATSDSWLDCCFVPHAAVQCFAGWFIIEKPAHVI